jgi:hypothetical protein
VRQPRELVPREYAVAVAVECGEDGGGGGGVGPER